MALTLLLPTPSFVNAFSCKDQSTAQGVALVSFCQAVTSETLLAARCHTHMGTNTTIQPSSFFPSHFSLTLFLSFYVLFKIWVIHLLLILPWIFTTKALKVLFLTVFFFLSAASLHQQLFASSWPHDGSADWQLLPPGANLQTQRANGTTSFCPAAEKSQPDLLFCFRCR